MQMPGVRDKWMKLSQAKSLGKAPLSRQLTVLPCKIQSFSSSAIYAEKRLFHFSSFFLYPLFSLELHLKAVKNFCDFSLVSFPTPSPVPTPSP